MSRLLRGVVATLAATVLLAGCQPSAPGSPTPSSPPPSPTATPTPTFLCTPEAGGEATECTQAQYDEMKAKDALYAEAEEVFREYFAENIRISRAGGVTEPTEVILKTTAGTARESVMAAFRGLAERQSRARGDDPTLKVERAPGISKEGSIVALLVCADGSGWAFYEDGAEVSRGRPAEDRVYFSTVDGAMKMTYIEGRWVKTCA